ncbi:MAG: hypothetical protein Q7T76_22335 [Ferruginibacter sp.]|nr:hypothetical protein [Ferruginibacter sp.]
MRKYLCSIFIAFFAIGINGCTTVNLTASSNKWLEHELAPSTITENGDVFFKGKLSDGSVFSVFSDPKIAADGDFYNAILRQDFGWKKRDDKSWSSPQGAREHKLGYIYINPSRRVAVYFYPDGKYHTAFKVIIDE